MNVSLNQMPSSQMTQRSFASTVGKGFRIAQASFLTTVNLTYLIKLLPFQSLDNIPSYNLPSLICLNCASSICDISYKFFIQKELADEYDLGWQARVARTLGLSAGAIGLAANMIIFLRDNNYIAEDKIPLFPNTANLSTSSAISLNLAVASALFVTKFIVAYKKFFIEKQLAEQALTKFSLHLKDKNISSEEDLKSVMITYLDQLDPKEQEHWQIVVNMLQDGAVIETIPEKTKSEAPSLVEAAG